MGHTVDLDALPVSSDGFRLRGHEGSRLENFSDAIFGFSLTLLVISLEVPDDYAALRAAMSGVFAFAACFLHFLWIWLAHHKFFLRYGLRDLTVFWLNALLLFTVMMYVYPLRFLFDIAFDAMIFRRFTHEMTVEDFPELMTIYAIGYIAVFSVLALLYLHALRRREHLGLSALEVYQSKAEAVGMALAAIPGVLSLFISHLCPPQLAPLFGGVTYAMNGPIQGIYWWRVGVKGTAVQSAEAGSNEGSVDEKQPSTRDHFD